MGGHKEVRPEAGEDKESPRANKGLEKGIEIKGLVIKWLKKPAKLKA
jgi:hypothetical protein